MMKNVIYYLMFLWLISYNVIGQSICILPNTIIQNSEKTYTLNIPAAAFKHSSNAYTSVNDKYILIPKGSTDYIYTPLLLPTGSKIIGFGANYKYYNDFNLPLQLYLIKTNCTNETIVLHKSGTQSVSGLTNWLCANDSFMFAHSCMGCSSGWMPYVSPNVLPYVLLNDAYYIRLFNEPATATANSPQLYFLSITYSLP